MRVLSQLQNHLHGDDVNERHLKRLQVRGAQASDLVGHSLREIANCSVPLFRIVIGLILRQLTGTPVVITPP